QRYYVVGAWELHPSYGPQFAFEMISLDVRALDLRGLELFLAERLPDIGKARSKALVNEYGFGALDVLREDPQAVVDAGLLTESGAGAGADGLRPDDRAIRQAGAEAYQLLKAAGGRVKPVTKLLRRYGTRLPEVLRNEPFRVVIDASTTLRFAEADRLWTLA